MTRKLLAAAAFSATLAALPFGHAQAADPYPNKPIELVVGYPAGGPTDVSARLIAQDLAMGLGVPVVITNKVGAGSLIATQQVQRTKPDGYTFLFASLGHNINPLLMPDRARYDPIKDFDLVTPVAVQPLVVVTAHDSQFSSLKELLAAARQKPESISYGSSGNGGVGHLGGELLAMQSGTLLANPVSRKRIEDVGNSVTGGSPADFERQLVNSTAAAEKVIKFANIKVD